MASPPSGKKDVDGSDKAEMEGEMKTCAIQSMCPLSIFIPSAVLHF